MMPQIVPNRPMKGPAEPTVASTSSRRSMCSISRAMATSMTFSMRICSPASERAWPSKLRLPFAHGGDKQRAGRMARLGCERLVEFLQRLAGPERLLEAVAGPADAREQQGLVDGDRPDPDRANDQPDHHRLDHPMGLPEQMEHRQIGRGQRQGRRHDVGRVHGRVLSPVGACAKPRPWTCPGPRRRVDERVVGPPAKPARRPDPKFREDPSRTRHRQDRESSPNLSKLGRNTRSFAPNEARLSLMRG